MSDQAAAGRQQGHYSCGAGSGGTAVFDRDGTRLRVAPGDLLFVPARMPHRFREISDDFETWVIFRG